MGQTLNFSASLSQLFIDFDKLCLSLLEELGDSYFFVFDPIELLSKLSCLMLRLLSQLLLLLIVRLVVIEHVVQLLVCVHLVALLLKRTGLDFLLLRYCTMLEDVLQAMVQIFDTFAYLPSLLLNDVGKEAVYRCLALICEFFVVSDSARMLEVGN